MSFTSTAAPQQSPGLPANFTPLEFAGFEGLNNHATRLAIKDTQAFWCHNLYPFGRNKLKTIPNLGATVFASAGQQMSITNFGSGGTAGTYALAFAGGGGAPQATGTFTVIAGKVKSFVITTSGAGYVGAPTVSFAACPGLVGAAATFTGAGNIAVSILNFKIFNIGTGSIYGVAFYANGAADFFQFTGVNPWPTVLSIPIGTFAVASTAGGYPEVIQWGNQYALIIASNGYWAFDGTLLYGAGTLAPVVTITNVGTGYGADPVVTVGGGTGAGATFTVTRTGGQIIAGQITNAGTGYVLADGIGSLTSILLTNPGAGGANGTFALGIAGGGGAGAAATFVVAGGIVTNIFITNGGAGYTTTPTFSFAASAGLVGATCSVGISVAPATLPLVFTGGGGTGAAGTISLMPFGVTGLALESYQQRIWIVKDNKIIYSAPSSFIDFSSYNGGGIITSTDSFLTASYINVFQSNGFLYYIADSSIGYISGVNTSGSPVVTTFSNVNVDPQVGSFWRDSMSAFSKNILLANNYGIHAIVGGSVQKISENVNGCFQVPITQYTANFSPSAVQMVLFGEHCWGLLLPQLIDPTTMLPTTDTALGRVMNILICWNGKSWFTATQSLDMTKVDTFEFDSIITAYATNGLNIFVAFTNTSSTIPQALVSRLWDTPSYLETKRSLRLMGLLQSPNTSAPAVNVYVDNENSGRLYPLGALTDPQYLAVPQKRFRLNVEQTGYLSGLTILTSEANLTFQSFLLLTQQYSTDL